MVLFYMKFVTFAPNHRFIWEIVYNQILEYTA
jgi:hypothetical protein